MHLFCDRAFEEATYGPVENTFTKISSSKDFVIVNNIWYSYLLTENICLQHVIKIYILETYSFIKVHVDYFLFLFQFWNIWHLWLTYMTVTHVWRIQEKLIWLLLNSPP